jgi:hypothetical protein
MGTVLPILREDIRRSIGYGVLFSEESVALNASYEASSPVAHNGVSWAEMVGYLQEAGHVVRVADSKANSSINPRFAKVYMLVRGDKRLDEPIVGFSNLRPRSRRR